MKIEQDKVRIAFRILANNRIRIIMHEFEKRNGLRYYDINEIVKGFNGKSKGGLPAHYIRLMRAANLLTHDKPTKIYYLTVWGLECMALIKKFEKMFVIYDMSEADINGKIVLTVQIKNRKRLII